MKLKKMVAVALTMSMAAAMMPATAMAEETANDPVVAEQAAVANVAETGGTEYETLAAAVAAAAPGATVTLLENAEGAGIVINKEITINFGGKTYTFTEPAAGSKGTESNGFQILKEAGKVTLTNGTLKVAEDFKDKFYILVQNYTDLTVKKMKLDGTYLDKYSLTDGDSYVLSNNHGKVSIEGTTIIANDEGDKAFAFDACKFASYDAPNVTVDKECKVYGNIEVSPEATLVIEGGSFTDLANAVKYAKDDAVTITLLESVKGAGIVIDKSITINFGGNTYTFTEPAVGSTGTKSNGFQILQEAGAVTLTNGTLEVAKDAAGAFYILVQNYADLTVEGMKLDGTYLDKYSLTDGDSYVLSNNHGKVSIEGTTIIANDEGDKAFAFDACKFASYDAPNVTVDKECKVYGNIEVSPEATLVIEGGSFTDLANAVKYAEGGAEIALLENAEGAGIVINKEITIDFGGNTYTFTEPAVGSTGTTTNGFQILQESGKVTLMKGALEVADAHKDKYYILIQNYTDLTVKDMKLDGKNLDKWSGTDGDSYVLSNNHGDVVITGDTTIIANDYGDKAYAFDVCDYANYDGVTVTFDENFKGGVKGNFEVDSSEEAKLVIYAGYFTQNPEAYVAEGKEVKDSDQAGYTYMVGEPTPEPTPTPSTGGGSKSKPKYTASVDKNDVDNGDVKLSSTRAKAGSKVTVTVTPDEGYELKKLEVLDKDGNKVDVTDNGDGTYTFKMPKGGVEVVPTFVEAEEQEPVEEPTEDADAAEKTTLVLTIGQTIYQMDGSYAANDVAPIISGDRTFLPIRLIAESLGATVGWDEAEQSVTIVKDGTTIVIYIGQAFATVNGEPVQLDAPAFIANDRTYLPVRFVAETLGAAVTWDAAAKTVTIIG